MSWRCQRSVSGLIGKTAQAGRASERLSDASSARSARVSFGREVCRRRIASSWRRTRISISFERRGRPSSHTARTGSGQRDTRTTRANSPPSTTARETNLASRTLRRAADEFANPTPSPSAQCSVRNEGSPSGPRQTLVLSDGRSATPRSPMSERLCQRVEVGQFKRNGRTGVPDHNRL
jgi:hypothetical protein